MKILIYGYGRMSSSVLSGWLRSGANPSDITVFNPRHKDVFEGVKFVSDVPDSSFDIILLGFKPQHLIDVTPGIQKVAGPKSIILSLLAGVCLEQLKKAFPKARATVRFMPNLAAELCLSPTILAAEGLSSADRKVVNTLADMVGSAEWLEDEMLFDLATALGGSGPGFVYRFIESLAEGANLLGLPKRTSQRIAVAMVNGAAALAARSDCSPSELATQVASPGGMTREGLNVLDKDKALKSLIIDVLKKTEKKGSEIASKIN
jgi:pyrroline-5-carboxylate reductase